MLDFWLFWAVLCTTKSDAFDRIFSGAHVAPFSPHSLFYQLVPLNALLLDY